MQGLGRSLSRFALGLCLAIGSAHAAEPADTAGQAPAPVAEEEEPVYPDSWTEYQDRLARADGGDKKTFETLPDWTGVWIRDVDIEKFLFSFDLDSGLNPLIKHKGAYAASSAKLTPKYQKAYDEKIANIANDIAWDRLSYCLPVGMPRWLADPFPKEFIATPDQTWLIHQQLQEIRRVYTDGRPHRPEEEAYPLWQGESIGFWDGDTLIIHTNNLKAGEYMRGQPDYSFKATTVERMRKTGPNEIEIKITVYDPESLLEPYKATFKYKKMEEGKRLDYMSCVENNNAVRTPEGGTTWVLPGEPGYQDPATFGIPPVALDSMPD